MNPLLNNNNLTKLKFYLGPNCNCNKHLNTQAFALLLKLNKKSVQDVVVNLKSLAEILVKDIGLANFPSLTKLCLTDGY